MSMASEARSRPVIAPEDRPWPAVIAISGVNPESRRDALRDRDEASEER